ncbi:methyltransferase domain-containing protein [Novosphingobium sp. M1R2S20]|uniref:Methyltransferase domain-containing protein n=1 Tax=Novosphingobium rhizovicinum TaxID=3228928 RepID=A0ABV3R8M8_9SPHN
MPDLRQRSLAPELMDGDDVTLEAFSSCMADLAQVNSVTMARRPTLAFIKRALDRMPSGACPVIMDVGFGAGDMLRSVARMLRRRKRQVRLIGVDLNWRSEAIARAAPDPELGIEWYTGDAYDWRDERAPDLVISSLVTHHMDDDEIVRFLAWMESTAKHGWFINDLHRHALAWHGFTAMAALARWHPFVRHDGPLSIARSFRREDWERLLSRAGVNTATVCWRFPFRYCVERLR